MSPAAHPALSDRQRAAFLGHPAPVDLPRGEHLYKIVSVPVIRDRVLESPWWIRERTFDDLRERAKRLQRPLKELVRAQLAITSEWNPGMDILWIVVLGAPVKAWEGRARSQRVVGGDASAAFIGGGRQVCVPQIQWRQIARDYSAHGF